jgi:predicted nucleic acid-binding protein
VVAAAVLAESGTTEEASCLLAGRWDLAAPSHWKAEFCNVIRKAVQLQRIAAQEIDPIIGRASTLPIESVDVAELWRGAVARAVDARHPAYDTLFVKLAIRLRTQVASFDAQLRRKFPSIVRSPGNLLRSS